MGRPTYMTVIGIKCALFMRKIGIVRMTEAVELDSFDRRILALIQRDATLSTAEIAERIGLSQSPCWRRIQRLRDTGVIMRSVALVDRRKLGLNTQLFVQVKLNAHGRAHLDEFTAAVAGFPEVLECYLLLGSVDFMLRVITADIEAYEGFFFERLSRLDGIQEVNSTITLSAVKTTTELPV